MQAPKPAAGGRYGGFPAKPYKKWMREILTLEKLAERGLADPGDGQNTETTADRPEGQKDKETRT